MKLKKVKSPSSSNGRQSAPKPHLVRITSGRYHHQSLAVPSSAHPMGSRERLALFNMLSKDLTGATVLDVFAGSGALGIEALSRGAQSVTFIEKDPRAAKIIRQNLKDLGITPEAATVVGSSARSFTNPSQAPYDIILIDPPYDRFSSEFTPEVFQKLANLLAPGAGSALALSYPSSFSPDLQKPRNLALETSRKYANCNIAIFRNI